MNVNYALVESTNSNITFIDLNKFLNYIIFQKENNFLDNKTKQYVNDITEKYNLEHFVNLDLPSLQEQKNQIVSDFNNKYKNMNEKINKLKNIQTILSIDLDYYNNQLVDITNILNNTDFKNDIFNINDKIINLEDLNEEEMNKLSFNQELLKQYSYIKNNILSSENKIIANQQDVIKNKLVEQMKLIENETNIYLTEAKLDKKINYNEIMDLWNDETLNKLMKKINMTQSEDLNNVNLKYKLVENLKKLTNKSHAEIELVIKDKKFKEKIFGNVNIVDINNKLNQLNEELKQYNIIYKFLDEINKNNYVCPFCNYKSDLPVDTILHLSLHDNKENFKTQVFNLYIDTNKNLRSKFSEEIVTDINKTFYKIKKQIMDSDEIKNYTLKSSIPKFDNIMSSQILSKILPPKINISKKIEEFRNTLNIHYRLFFTSYPDLKKDFIEIIDSNIEKMFSKYELMDELFGEEKINFTYVNKIIDYQITKKILNQYFNDDDISNLYNSNIQFFDDNLKNNKTIDTLFKTLIHYNTYEPVVEIKKIMNSFIKIIRNTNDLEKMLFSNVTGTQYKRFNNDNKTVIAKTVPIVEVTEYLDYHTLLLLIPILKNRNFTLQIQNLINSDEFVINDDDDKLFKPWEWVSKSEYNKMISLLSNIKKQDIDIQTIVNDESDDFKKLQQTFSNIDNENMILIQKEFQSITEIFESFLLKSRVAHDINTIDNNKDINGKFKEYVLGSYLMSTLNLLNKIVVSNIDNTTNTKTEIFNVFSVLSIYLNKESSYLAKNKNVFQKERRVIQKVNVEKNNKDEILNEYFDSDDEENEVLEQNFEQDNQEEDRDMFNEDDDVEYDEYNEDEDFINEEEL